LSAPERKIQEKSGQGKTSGFPSKPIFSKTAFIAGFATDN
jgi:hypothetical protein